MVHVLLPDVVCRQAPSASATGGRLHSNRDSNQASAGDPLCPAVGGRLLQQSCNCSLLQKDARRPRRQMATPQPKSNSMMMQHTLLPSFIQLNELRLLNDRGATECCMPRHSCYARHSSSLASLPSCLPVPRRCQLVRLLLWVTAARPTQMSHPHRLSVRCSHPCPPQEGGQGPCQTHPRPAGQQDQHLQHGRAADGFFIPLACP